MLNSLLAGDVRLFFLINGAHTPFFDAFFLGATWLGNGWVTFPLFFLAAILRSSPFGWGRVLDPPLRLKESEPGRKESDPGWKGSEPVDGSRSSRHKFTGVLLAGAVAFTAGGVLTSGIKKVLDRPRPATYCSIHRSAPPVHVVGPRLGSRSFPSGHAQTAFTAAVLLVLLYGGAFWASLPAAFLVAYSRVYVGAHFPLDALGGMALGTISAWAAMILCRRWIRELPSAENVDNEKRTVK